MTYLNVAVLVGGTLVGGTTVAVALIDTPTRLLRLDIESPPVNLHNEFKALAANGNSISCNPGRCQLDRGHMRMKAYGAGTVRTVEPCGERGSVVADARYVG